MRSVAADQSLAAAIGASRLRQKSKDMEFRAGGETEALISPRGRCTGRR